MTSTQFKSILVSITLIFPQLYAQENMKPAAEKPAGISPDAPKPPTPEELEAKRLADEAEQKRREQAKKEAEEAARLKAEAEKSFFTKLLENSKLYTGAAGGLGVGLNKIHGTGYTIGMSIDYLAYKTYGFHFAAETGQYPAKDGTLSTGGVPVTISGGGSFGLLVFDLAAVYALPPIWNLEPAMGAGISLYQLRGGSYDFNQSIAPLVYGSVYYNLLSHLQVGLITQLTFASASKIQSTGTTLALDNGAALTTLNFKLSLRYAWF